MAVDDHGLEVLKKSGEEFTPGDKSDQYIKTSKVIDLTVLFEFANATGLTSGESWDKVVYGVLENGNCVLEYSLSGLCQFQIELIFNSQESFSVCKRPCLFNLLQENGDFLLQENGDNLQIQGLVP